MGGDGGETELEPGVPGDGGRRQCLATEGGDRARHSIRRGCCGTWYLVVAYRGNGVIHRGIYQLQGDDNGHVGRRKCGIPSDSQVLSLKG